MPDQKDYYVKNYDMGDLKISEDVVASIVSTAALETDGVASLNYGFARDLASLIGKKGGVRIALDGDSVGVDLTVTLRYGCALTDVGREIQKKVASAVESMAGLRVKAVNVQIAGIEFPKEQKPEPAPADPAVPPEE